MNRSNSAKKRLVLTALVAALVAVLWIRGAVHVNAAGECQAEYDPSSRTWTLSNSKLQAQFRLDSEDHFVLDQITNLETGRIWSPPPDEPVSPVALVVDGEVISAARKFWLVSQSASEIDRGGLRQTLVLAPEGLSAELRIELDVYPGHGFLRYRSFYTPQDPAPHIVSSANLLPWTFAEPNQRMRLFFVGQWHIGGEEANFEPHLFDFARWSQPVEMKTGSYGLHITWATIRDRQDHGLAFGWEFDGRSRARFLQDPEGRFRTMVEVEELNHAVRPGQEFAVPGAFLGVFQGDWDEAGYRTQRFVEAALAAPNPDRDNFPYLMWDSWGYQYEIDEGLLMAAARRAAEAGVEVFTVDLGWAVNIGDWRPDPSRFPNGLRPLSDYVRSLGMKFGLHMAFSEASPESPVLIDHPEWTADNDMWRGYFGALGLCLSHEPVTDWVSGEIIRVVRDYGVDWLLQDGENIVKPCRRPDHTHRPGDSNYSNAVKGLNEIQRRVKAELPDLLWENCEDGGNIMTYNMVGHYVTSIINDNASPTITRQSVYGATYALPPRYTDRYVERDPWSVWDTRTHFFGGPVILMNRIADWYDFQMETMQREAALYKSIRTLIRDGKVYHLTPRPDGFLNDAIQSHDPVSERSVIFVYREQGDRDQEVIRPKGLDPVERYRVRLVEAGTESVWSGAALKDEGIRVPLPERCHAEVILIERLVSAKPPTLTGFLAFPRMKTWPHRAFDPTIFVSPE